MKPLEAKQMALPSEDQMKLLSEQADCQCSAAPIGRSFGKAPRQQASFEASSQLNSSYSIVL
jgi:hypothetical protein